MTALAASTTVTAAALETVVIPACESCEQVAATVTVTFRDDQFKVCTACMPADLVLLQPSGGHDGR